LAFLGRHAVANSLSGNGLLSWLTGQKSQIQNALPAGFNLSSVFDGGAPTTARPAEPAKKTIYNEPKKTNKWLLPVLALIGIGLLWYLIKGRNKTEETVPATEAPATAPAVTETAPPPPPPPPARESMKVKLADGTEINAYKGGIEDKLVAFLNDPNAKPGNDVWFDFDNLNFETGSAKITSESQVQVNNIAAILKAYPKTEIKIGGYTDKVGKEPDNMKLSQERADATVAAIKAAGANPRQLLGGEGFGSKFAKAAADAPDSEREKDRRISVSVRKK
jgi:outer membrane protein OmpA-like peptidoglycan-associated protein